MNCFSIKLINSKQIVKVTQRLSKLDDFGQISSWYVLGMESVFLFFKSGIMYYLQCFVLPPSIVTLGTV